MGEEFNFPSDNDDHFWKMNTPTSPISDPFDPYKLDFSSQPLDTLIDQDLPFDANAHNLGYENTNAQLGSVLNIPNPDSFVPMQPDMGQFSVNEQFTTTNPISYSLGQNISVDQSYPSEQNQQFGQSYEPQIPNPNISLSQSFNQVSPELSVGVDPKLNMMGLPPNTNHRRTPSTPANLFNLNALALQQLQQVQQQQQTQKQQVQKQISQLTPAQIQQILNHEISIPVNRNRKMSSQPLPIVPSLTSSGDEEFNTICKDQQIKFNPHKLGFIPTKFWPDKEFTLGELVSDFFQRKNNANSRFYHKLYNALKITEDDPFYSEYLGIEWVNNNVLKVDKKKFARLLNIKTIDGSLFHQQGNFPSHGFVELGTNEALNYVNQEDLDKVDYENVRLLIHQAGIFVKGCTEAAIEGCKWVSSRKRH